MSRSDIDETVRHMWSTRPHRRKDDRKIAGVAAAIGRRYRIDPVLVRVAFVVTAISGGVGLVLYLLGWLLLPEEGDEVSGAEALIGHGRSSMSKPLTIVLMIALIPASSGLFTGRFSALFTAAVVGVGLYLLHRHRGTGPQPTMAGAFDVPTADPSAPTMPNQATGPGDRTSPPAWDPLGAAPFAWDLPEPSPAGPPPEPPRRQRSAVTPVTIALALMVGGAAALVAMTSSTLGAAEVAAVTLAVIGAGLVVGSFVRGGRGLIAVAIPLALVTYGMSVSPFGNFGPPHGAGDRTWQVQTVAEVDPIYRLSAGDATLDLSQLDLSDDDTVRTTVQLGAGDLRVVLPRDADVEVHCEAGVGDLGCLGESQGGINPSLDTTDNGPDGPGGGKIILNASVGAGDLRVTRDE